MAQYYNIVTGTTVPIMVEDVQQICDGQSIQLVVEDINNCTNGGQQFLTYTASPQRHDSGLFPQRTILGSQLTGLPIEQRQNVYIINTTSDLPIQQSGLKAEVVHASLSNDGIVNIVDDRGNQYVIAGTKLPLNNIRTVQQPQQQPQQQQIQWISMSENNVNYEGTMKQAGNTVKVAPLPRLTEYASPGPSDKKQGPRICRGRGRGSVTGGGPARQSLASSDSGAATKGITQKQKSPNKSSSIQSSPSVGVQLLSNDSQNSTATSNRTVTTSGACRGKSAPLSNVALQNVNPRTPTRAAIFPRSSEGLTKTMPPLHYPLMDTLSEKIKNSKVQKVLSSGLGQASNLPVNVPTTPSARPPIHGTPRPLLQLRGAQNSTAVRGNAPAGIEKSSSCGQQRVATSPGLAQQRRQPTPKSSPQMSQDSRQTDMTKRQTSTTCQQTYQRSTATDTDEKMEVDRASPECSFESDSTDNHDPNWITDDNGSASYAYLQKVIENPQNTIVQNQIPGNTVKMLVVLRSGEQRLITFDIPNEPCTVQDLLEQAKISFGEKTCVSLVSDRKLGINYIVEGGAQMSASCDGSSDSTEGSQESVPDSSTQNVGSADDSSNSPTTPNEEPKFCDGKLAVCPHCGISSLDFHRCSRCKRILPDNVKSIPMTPDAQSKKESMISVQEQNASMKLETAVKLDAARGRKLPARGGRRSIAKTRPQIKEPECLTISSDEEETSEKLRKSNSNMSSVSSSSGCGLSSGDLPDMIIEKEPVITNTSGNSPDEAADSESETKGGGDDEAHEDGSGQKLQTSLVCRTVRIGSYKYIPREPVVISQNGIMLSVPLLEDDKSFVNLDVKLKEIKKVLIHFGKAMPVLFVYTSISFAATIREVLGMQDPKGPYYDPVGRDHTHKRITLLPEVLSTESKTILKSLLIPGNLLAELSPKEANEILVHASPKDVLQNVQASLGGPGRKSTLSSTSSNPVANGSSGQSYQIMTVYPPPPSKGGIAINTEDYVCLGEDQFLNDAIIDFYLRYLTMEVLSEEDHNRTHVFSSYFYKRLTSPHAQTDDTSSTLTPAARRHTRVQKWTKNVNIFEKDFVIIPINEHAHWFLAIICYPGLVGKVIATPKTPKEKSTQKSGQKNKKTKDMKVQALTIGSTTITPVTPTIQLDEGSERDEAEGDDEEMEMDSDDEEDTENQESNGSPLTDSSSPETNEKPADKIPCILIFDSLAGASRSRVVATLRDYLSCEHVAKVGTEKVFSKDTIKGSSPKVPQQSNFTDCGLYLLQYVESFFQNPIENYTLPIKTLKNWFEEIIVTRKREELAKLLVRLMNQTKGEKNITLPVVQFPTHDGKLRPKPETSADAKAAKSETEGKKKGSGSLGQGSANVDDKTRLVALSTSSVLTTTENTGEKPEVVTRTTTVYQIIPCTPSPLNVSSGDSSQEIRFDIKPKSTSGTLSYLRNKRIPRLMSRDQEGQENQPTAAKKHKGENESATRSLSGSSSSGASIVTTPKAVTATNNDSCK